jgi:hypothetical protein
VKKSEAKFKKELLKMGFDIWSQPTFGWCASKTTNKLLPFDFFIPEYKIIIELDGPQHFRQISNWRTHEKQREIDLYKMDCANKNGWVYWFLQRRRLE